jgi:transmembrane sensor
VVDFSAPKRNIRLLYGEAHFEVAKDKSRPFNVHAGGGIVRAVGTAFTVRLRKQDAVEVTVEEGRVALGNSDPLDVSGASIESLVALQPLAELTAGQSATFSKQVNTLTHLEASEIKRKLAWRQGLLAYSGDPLFSVVEDVSRYTDINIKIRDVALRNLSVAGYFRVGEVEAFLESLELTFGVNVEHIDERHVELSSKKIIDEKK